MSKDMLDEFKVGMACKQLEDLLKHDLWEFVDPLVGSKSEDECQDLFLQLRSIHSYLEYATFTIKGMIIMDCSYRERSKDMLDEFKVGMAYKQLEDLLKHDLWEFVDPLVGSKNDFHTFMNYYCKSEDECQDLFLQLRSIHSYLEYATFTIKNSQLNEGQTFMESNEK